MGTFRFAILLRVLSRMNSVLQDVFSKEFILIASERAKPQVRHCVARDAGFRYEVLDVAQLREFSVCRLMTEESSEHWTMPWCSLPSPTRPLQGGSPRVSYVSEQ